LGRNGKGHFPLSKKEVFLMGKRFGWFMVFVAAVVVFCFHGQALAKKSLKGFDTLVVQSVTVKPDAGIPERYASNLKDALLRQLQRYNAKYKWFKKITTKMPSSKGGVVLLDAEILSYVPPTVGRRIGKSFIPGGGHMGSASVQFNCKFIDGEKRKVVLKKDVNAKSSGSNDSVEYAIERGAEYVAKVVHKNR
jgi:hypothetical protein